MRNKIQHKIFQEVSVSNSTYFRKSFRQLLKINDQTRDIIGIIFLARS